MKRLIWAALGALALMTAPAQAQLVDVQRFVDEPTYHGAQMSPDGQYVAVIQKTTDGDLLVLITLATHEARALQHVTERMGHFGWVAWKGNDHLILNVWADSLYERAVSRVFALNRDGSGLVQIFEGTFNHARYGSATLLDNLPNDPTHVLLRAGSAVWRGDITTGHIEHVIDSDSDMSSFSTYATDGQGAVVMRFDSLHDGSGYRIFRRAAGTEDWTFVLEARRAEVEPNSPDFSVMGPGPGANQVYVLARPDNKDLASLYLYDTATGERGEPIQEGATADIATPWINPRTREILATCEFSQRLSCHARDPQVQQSLNALDRFFHGRMNVSPISISDDGLTWLLHVEGPTEPGAYYLFDRAHAAVEMLAKVSPNLDQAALSPTEVVEYNSRDGAHLWAYVTAQPGAQGPRPMIVFPHGGPEARDFYGYDPLVEFFASRGYVVLQPNFRGSGGFGRAFTDAGRGQWGLRMQDDITDAVQHMIESGAADAHRICIVGASYGGYAALAGAALTPDLYRCAISIAGVADLLESLRTEREGGSQTVNYQYWLRSMGDPRANRDALIAASPYRQAAHIHIPVLLVHGDLDPVVPLHQSLMMQDALKDAGHPTRVVRFRLEGHAIYAWEEESRLTLFRETEAFLAQNLGPAN